MFQIVKTNFTKASVSQPSKSIAVVLLEGTYTKDDLRSINVAFPSNSLNALKDPEGPYNSQEAMFQFIKILGPYLSDQQLYRLVETFTDLASDAGDAVFRQSSLAKCAFLYEFERNAKDLPEGVYPEQCLSHIKKYFVPLFTRLNPDTVADNITRFNTHNINEAIVDPAIAAKYKGRDLFQAVSQFDETKFNADDLSNQASADKNVFQASLTQDKKPSPPRDQSEVISRPKGEAIKATPFFATTAKVGDAVATEIRELNKECETYVKRITSNCEILKKITDELTKVTDDPTLKHYANVKTKLEDQIRTDSEKLQKLKTAITQLQESVPGVQAKR